MTPLNLKLKLHDYRHLDFAAPDDYYPSTPPLIGGEYGDTPQLPFIGKVACRLAIRFYRGAPRLHLG